MPVRFQSTDLFPNTLPPTDNFKRLSLLNTCPNCALFRSETVRIIQRFLVFTSQQQQQQFAPVKCASRTDIWRRFAERDVLYGCGSSIIMKLLLLILMLVPVTQTNGRLTDVFVRDELVQALVVAPQRHYFALKKHAQKMKMASRWIPVYIWQSEEYYVESQQTITCSDNFYWNATGVAQLSTVRMLNYIIL